HPEPSVAGGLVTRVMQKTSPGLQSPASSHARRTCVPLHIVSSRDAPPFVAGSPVSLGQQASVFPLQSTLPHRTDPGVGPMRPPSHESSALVAPLGSPDCDCPWLVPPSIVSVVRPPHAKMRALTPTNTLT